MLEDNENYRKRDLVELVRRRYRDLEALNPRHDLLPLVNISDEELRLRSEIGWGRYNFALVNYVRLLGRAIREELENRLEEKGLLEMVKRYIK